MDRAGLVLSVAVLSLRAQNLAILKLCQRHGQAIAPHFQTIPGATGRGQQALPQCSERAFLMARILIYYNKLNNFTEIDWKQVNDLFPASGNALAKSLAPLRCEASCASLSGSRMRRRFAAGAYTAAEKSGQIPAAA